MKCDECGQHKSKGDFFSVFGRRVWLCSVCEEKFQLDFDV
jgi:hypothetical protein